jgi:tetratricopeptide (TPR) repeat protein
MKHLLFSFLFVFSANTSCFGQAADFAKVYYPNINDAELAIARAEFKDALSYYKKAFESVPTGFARDYRNAVLCAIRSNDDAFAFDYLEKLVLKGFGKDFLADTIFKPLNSKRGWKKLMDSYDCLHQKSLTNNHSELLRALIAMGERDQLFRSKEGSYEIYGDTIAKIDEENVLRFQQLVVEHGFPTKR